VPAQSLGAAREQERGFARSVLGLEQQNRNCGPLQCVAGVIRTEVGESRTAAGHAITEGLVIGMVHAG